VSKTINRADEFKKMIAPLDKMMKYTTEFQRVFGKRGTSIISAYQVMTTQLLALAPKDAKPVKVTNREKAAVRQAARVMTAVVTGESISRYFRDFAGEYLPLMNNWNRQIGKDQITDTMVRATQRILDDMMTMKDITEVARGATKRLQELLRYKPAAFDLSRHYLRSLQDDIEKKETTEKKAVSGVSKRVDNVKVGVQQC